MRLGTSTGTDPCPPNPKNWGVFPIALWGAWVTAVTISFLIEANRIRELLIRDRTIGNFWNSPNPDSTFLFPLVLLGPFCLGFRFYSATTKSLQDDATARQTGVRPPSRVLRILAPTTIFVLSLAVSVRTTMLLATHERPSRTFRDETPVIHDEFSYLLQAKTFLSRRWFWESSPVARELFHQMHVLNDGKFASRYLPGTGLWIAPWLAMGHPRWGHWFAQGSVAVAAYLLSKRLTEMSRADGKRLPNGPGLAGIPTASWSGLIAGIVAGTLIALSPGLALFSNLMLSHHPTLVGLSLFLWAFLHLMETSAMRWSLLSGAGLAFAMICRPLTAAAVGLPWGFWWLFQVRMRQSPAIRDGNTPSLGIPWLRVSLGMGAPLILGFALVGWQNFALTGNLWTTGYTRYNELYTPSHVFGFHNRVDPDAPLPKTLLKDYDAWPADLNMKLAMRNVWNRLNGTLKWHLSLPLLAMSTGYLLFSIHGQPRPIQLLFLSVVCLHVAHIPYWLDGILQHHYVFESGFLLVILFSVVSGQLLSMALAQQRWLFPIWWTMLVTLTVCLNQFAVSKVGIPKIQQGLGQILFAAPHYHRFEQLLASAELKTPALVVVLPTAGDLHVEYVRNLPPFDSEILVGMDRSEQFTPQSIVELFPERTVYFYDSRTSEFTLGTERGESDD